MKLLDLPETPSTHQDAGLTGGPSAHTPDGTPGQAMQAMPESQAIVLAPGMRRIAAFALDFMIVFIGTTVLFAVAETALQSKLSFAYIWPLWILYFASFESSSWQATPGKYALGLKVYSKHLTRPTFLRACLRRFSGSVLMHPFFFYIDAYKLIRGQRMVKDRLSKTCVALRNPDMAQVVAAPRRALLKQPKRRIEES